MKYFRRDSPGVAEKLNVGLYVEIKVVDAAAVEGIHDPQRCLDPIVASS